jgi:hypothetical protein
MMRIGCGDTAKPQSNAFIETTSEMTINDLLNVPTTEHESGWKGLEYTENAQNSYISQDQRSGTRMGPTNHQTRRAVAWSHVKEPHQSMVSNKCCAPLSYVWEFEWRSGVQNLRAHEHREMRLPVSNNRPIYSGI